MHYADHKWRKVEDPWTDRDRSRSPREREADETEQAPEPQLIDDIVESFQGMSTEGLLDLNQSLAEYLCKRVAGTERKK